MDRSRRARAAPALALHEGRLRGDRPALAELAAAITQHASILREIDVLHSAQGSLHRPTPLPRGADWVLLGTALAACTGLEELRLAHTVDSTFDDDRRMLFEAGMERSPLLSEVFSCLSRLATLHLDRLFVSARVLCALAQSPPALACLKLTAVNMGPPALCLLAAALQPTLVHLDLSDNPLVGWYDPVDQFDESGVAALADALGGITLETLRLNGVALGPAGRLVAACLQRCPTLRKLGLEQCLIADEALAAVCAAATPHPALQSLSLTDADVLLLVDGGYYRRGTAIMMAFAPCMARIAALYAAIEALFLARPDMAFAWPSMPTALLTADMHRARLARAAGLAWTPEQLALGRQNLPGLPGMLAKTIQALASVDLPCAAYDGDVEACRAAVRWGQRVNVRHSTDGSTPLHMAVLGCSAVRDQFPWYTEWADLDDAATPYGHAAVCRFLLGLRPGAAQPQPHSQHQPQP
eukprot:m.52387 g.52387  ORF g.52387 m.52387 type:complete len:470 (+) comp6374_c0_seq1:133-1542(+)